MRSDTESLLHISPSGTAQLTASIHDAAGKSVLANIFPVLQHHESGHAWRRIMYLQSRDVYVWQRLPAGSYTLRVTAAGMRPVARELSLRAGEHGTVDVLLVSAHNQPPLILPVAEHVQAARRFVARLTCDPDHLRRLAAAPELDLGVRLAPNDGSSPALQLRLETRLLMTFLVHDALRDALNTRPTPRTASAWHGCEAALRSAWELRACPDLAERIVVRVIRNRLRLMAVTRAAFDVPAVRSLLPELQPAAVARQIARCMQALDYPELDEVLGVLGGFFEQETAPVARFFGALIGRFDVRLPAAVARNRGPDAVTAQRGYNDAIADAAQPIDAAAQPQQLDDGAEASDLIFTLHMLAQTMAFAIDCARGAQLGAPA